MNEQFEKLAMMANSQTGNEFDLNNKRLDALLAKFAELIVKDCIQVIKNESMDSGDEWEDGLCMAEDAIKHNFGVEE